MNGPHVIDLLRDATGRRATIAKYGAVVDDQERVASLVEIVEGRACADCVAAVLAASS